MATQDIAIFVSDKLYNYTTGQGYLNGYRAANVAETFIQGAFSNTTGQSVVTTIASEIPDPPKEAAGADVEGDICNNQANDPEYNTLWGWWNEWIDDAPCKDPHTEASDVNLLITSGDGGGRALQTECVASVGKDLIELNDTYTRFGYDLDLHNAVDTVLEEVGHCLVENPEDQDFDGAGHDSGAVHYDSDNDRYGITPIGMNDDNNNCLDSPHPKSKADTDGDGRPEGWSFAYSDCSASFMN